MTNEMLSQTAAHTVKCSRSGAQAVCPLCGKRLRGDRGLAAHLADVHRKVRISDRFPNVARWLAAAEKRPAGDGGA